MPFANITPASARTAALAIRMTPITKPMAQPLESTAIGALVGLFFVLSKANDLIAADGIFISATEGRSSRPILLAEPVVAVRQP